MSYEQPQPEARRFERQLRAAELKNRFACSSLKAHSLRLHYNLLVAEVKPFRLTESVKAAG
jgi:hypothetical protein